MDIFSQTEACLQETKFSDNMNFIIGLYLNKDIIDRASIINKLEKELSSFLQDRFYGEDVKTFGVGIICVSPEFKQFLKPRKPVYIKLKKDNTSGTEKIIEKTIELEIDIDYETFKKVDTNTISKFLLKEITRNLDLVLVLKIKDFDFYRFKNDLMEYQNQFS
jgi:hypothetical protein